MTHLSRTLAWRGGLTAILLGWALGCAAAGPVGDPSRESYGRPLNGRAARGQTGQHVLVSFWATWCKPCRAEVPLLEALARRYSSDRLLVVAVNHGEDVEVVRRFVRGNEKLTMTVSADPDREISGRFGVTSIPTVALIDPQDRVLWKKSGYSLQSFETILREVSRIVEEPPAGE